MKAKKNPIQYKVVVTTPGTEDDCENVLAYTPQEAVKIAAGKFDIASSTTFEVFVTTSLGKFKADYNIKKLPDSKA